MAITLCSSPANRSKDTTTYGSLKMGEYCIAELIHRSSLHSGIFTRQTAKKLYFQINGKWRKAVRRVSHYFTTHHFLF